MTFHAVLVATVLVVAVLVVATNAQSSYCQLCNDHTMCKYQGKGKACGQYISGGVSQADINTIVSAHNAKRQRVASGQETRGSNGGQPGATNMQNMEWDQELAAIAQRWVDQCLGGHDTCRKVSRFSCGQNYYGSGYSKDEGTPDWNAAINSWYNEVDLFNRNNIDPFRYSGSTGHYTQVVWATSNKVGCGYVYHKASGSGMYSKKYICNYGPAGNVQGPGQKMYEVKTSGK